MKRSIQKLLGIAALALTAIGGSFIAASPAQAQSLATCTAYTIGNSYPTDIGGGHAFLCKNTATNVVPSNQRAAAVFATVYGPYAGSINMPAGVKNRLKTNNVKYFFFNNRQEANSYFANTLPYSGGPSGVTFPNHPYNSPSARCANTGYGYTIAGVLHIAIAVYNNCNFDNLVPPQIVANPSLEKTVLHETGHAFDFTFASSGSPTNFPSNRGGFLDLSNKDKDALTTPKPGIPPAVWSGLTVQQRDKLVCTLFAPNGNKPSDLERDLGATLDGGAQGQVCIAGSPNGIRYSYWVGLTLAQDYNPQQIATMKKLPYFMNNNQELFVELFVTEIYGVYGPSSFLQLTDGVLHNDAIVSTPGYKRSFDCTRNIVKTYITTLAPPPITFPGCVTTGGNL